MNKQKQCAIIHWRDNGSPGSKPAQAVEVSAFYTEGGAFAYIDATTGSKVYIPVDLVSVVELKTSDGKRAKTKAV